jgi:hypothetical protein
VLRVVYMLVQGPHFTKLAWRRQGMVAHLRGCQQGANQRMWASHSVHTKEQVMPAGKRQWRSIQSTTKARLVCEG